MYLQFNCNTLHHLNIARHKVSGNHKTRKGHEYVQLPNSYTNTEVSEKSEPKLNQVTCINDRERIK